jgi:predicted CopG family antitoxin
MAKGWKRPKVEYVNMRLTKQVHDQLKEIGRKNETFSDVIARLIVKARKS